MADFIPSDTAATPRYVDGAPWHLLLGGVAAAGLGGAVAGWPAALVGGIILAVAAWLILPRSASFGRYARFGLANRVTLGRLVATGVIAGAALGEAALSPFGHWAVFALGVFALAADGLDGRLARKRGEADAFGARFDMETDAAFMAALSAFVWQAADIGAWVLLAGLLRYAFVLAGLVLPWLNNPLPPSFRRRLACAIGAGGLIAAALPALPAALAAISAGVATLALVISFLIDVRGLYHAEQSRLAAAEEPRKTMTAHMESTARLMSASETQISGPDRAANMVHRAVGEFRRGQPVALTRQGAVLAIVSVIEGLGDAAALARLAQFGTISAVLTGMRAMKLGLTDGDRGAVELQHPQAFDLAALHGLADPEAAYRPDPAIGIRPADAAGKAAIGLAKTARLLPAMVLVRPDRALVPAGLMTLDLGVWESFARDAGHAVREVARARVPLEGAEDATLVSFRPDDGGKEHLAIVIGEPDLARPVLARLHSECFTGDLLGSLRCDCGEQLRGAISEIQARGGGVLLYLAQEGRGIGLVNKLRAYRLQDGGFDTVDANELLGYGSDERVYAPAAAMLRALGITQVALMTNNPEKLAGLEEHGVTVVERVPHAFPANGHNARYLATKAERSGHLL